MAFHSNAWTKKNAFRYSFVTEDHMVQKANMATFFTKLQGKDKKNKIVQVKTIINSFHLC